MKQAEPTLQSLAIKNMVCHRCTLTVQSIFDNLSIPYKKVSLGHVTVSRSLSEVEFRSLSHKLNLVGFELIETRLNQLIERIKVLVLEYLNLDINEKSVNLSTFITDTLPYDYSYLSDLFSSAEGRTVEQYFILSRIEKVKELMVYDQQTLSEIADQVGFSSVHHLSAQFKKVTGLTPSHFRKIGQEKRQFLDQI